MTIFSRADDYLFAPPSGPFRRGKKARWQSHEIEVGDKCLFFNLLQKASFSRVARLKILIWKYAKHAGSVVTIFHHRAVTACRRPARATTGDRFMPHYSAKPVYKVVLR
jgi:hypothetical protein